MAKKKKQRKKQRKSSKAKFVKPKRAAATAVAATGSAGFFAIMLDRLRKVHPMHFPITAAKRTIPELEVIGQHDGRYGLLPRQDWRADLKQEKDLINAVTGQRDDGCIYELTRA